MSQDVSAKMPARRRAPRWMWGVMIVSLALNLLVIGGVIGAAWHFRYVRAFGEGGAPPRFGAFIATLPAEKRGRIDAMLSEQRAVIRPLRREMREARRAALAAVTAEPFDKDRLRALNAAYHRKRQALHEKRADLFPEILALLDGDERQKLLNWRMKRERWRRWHRHQERD